MITTPQKWYRPSRCNYVYLCQIAADGTFLLGPEGWTAEKTGTGAYTITHGLGNSNYLALSGIQSTDYKDQVFIAGQTDTAVQCQTFDNGQPADWAFRIMVIATQ